MPDPSAVLVRIRGALPGLQPAEQRVATAVLDDPAAASSLSVQALAAQASTSTATVLRFCRAVGAEGYPQLRLALAGAVAAEAALEPGRPAGDINAADSLDQVIAKIVHNEARALAETGAQLDRFALRTAVDAIAGARRIDVVGIGASGLVALDLQQKLHRIGRISFAWSDTHIMLTSAAVLGPGDVAVGISHTGATIDTVETLRVARDRGATTVALTNFPTSPITEVADLVLTTAARETTFRSGAMASRIAQLTVIDCLFIGVAQRHLEQSMRALDDTREAVGAHRLETRHDGRRKVRETGK